MYRPSLGTRGEARRAQIEAETALLGRVRPWTLVPNQPCPLAPHVFVPRWIRAPDPPSSPLKASATAQDAHEASPEANLSYAVPPPAFDAIAPEKNAGASAGKHSLGVRQSAETSEKNDANANENKALGPDVSSSEPIASRAMRSEGPTGAGSESMLVETEKDKTANVLVSEMRADSEHPDHEIMDEDGNLIGKGSDVVMEDAPVTMKSDGILDATKSVSNSAAKLPTAGGSSLELDSARGQSFKGDASVEGKERPRSNECEATSHHSAFQQHTAEHTNPTTFSRAGAMALEALQSGPTRVVDDSTDPSVLADSVTKARTESTPIGDECMRLTDASCKSPGLDAFQEQVSEAGPGQDVQISADAMQKEGVIDEESRVNVDIILPVEDSVSVLEKSAFDFGSGGTAVQSETIEDPKRSENG